MEADMDNIQAHVKLWAAAGFLGLAAKAEKTGAQAKILSFRSIDDLKANRAMPQAKVDEVKDGGKREVGGVQGRYRARLERYQGRLE